MAEEKEITLNQIGTMLEGIRSDVKAVAEGHGVIRSEMKQMEERLSEKISFVDGKVEFLGGEVRDVKKDLGEVKKDLGEVKKDLGEVKKDLGEVKEKVDRIDRTLDAHVKLPAMP